MGTIITDLFSNEHTFERLFNSREDTLARVRFLKAERARGCSFGTSVTAKEIRCRPA